MLANLTKLTYLLRETWAGLQRGGWMNGAAISTVTVLLFLFGLCLQTSWQLDALFDHFGTQLEVSVYLEPEMAGAELLPTVETLPTVDAVRLVTKEEAWDSLLTELGVSDRTLATQQLEGNPLVDELKVTVINPTVIPAVVQQLQGLEGVDRAVYINEATERFRQIQRGLNWVSITITVVLSLTAIAVITTTLNLIALARQNELEIMQLVGATKAWILLPFVLHGIFFGAVGGAIALLLITLLRTLLQEILMTQTGFLRFLAEGFTINAVQHSLLSLVVLSLGISIGTAGSLFAIRRVSFR
jgi:cell division transport system permease protein